jgi:transcriptional regulator with XRE-family HTH domain
VHAATVFRRFRHFVGNATEYRVDNLLKRFGDRLRSIRTRKGISQEKLAEIAGVHRTFVSSVERGERNISLLNIARLAKALEVSLARLMPT